MVAAEEYLDVFQGAKRGGNTLAVLPKRATPENGQILTAPRGCGDNGAGGCVGFALTARKGMLTQAVLPAAHSYRNGLYAIYSAVP